MSSQSLHFDHVFLPEGWQTDCLIEVRDGLITQITPSAGRSMPHGTQKVTGWALPGLPNLHSHCFQRGMAGLSERRGPQGDSFWTWREVMYRFLDRLDPDAVEAIASMAMLEMLENGYTSLAEFHYLHHDPHGRPYANRAEMAERIIAAADKTGLCLTLLPVFYAHGDFGGAAPNPGQRRFLSSLDDFETLFSQSRHALRALHGARLGLAPHSLRAVTPAQLQALIALCPQGPIHIHVAEQQKEVEACLAWSGQRPVAWLLDHMPLDQRWCLIHATHITTQECQDLARSGAVAGLCPITEANLGDGLFPAPAFCEAGGRIGVGSDSNIEIVAAHELRWLEYGQRLFHQGRNLLAQQQDLSTGEQLYRMACAGGAQALDQAVGRIAIDQRADFVVLNPAHPTLSGQAPAHRMDAYVFSAGPQAIKHVICGGITRVSDGHHHKRDEIIRAYQACMKQLLA